MRRSRREGIDYVTSFPAYLASVANLSRAALFLALAACAAPQAPAQLAPAVVPIAAPRRPLPSEEASAGITKFSFIAYGDTRNVRDGRYLQEVHGWIVESVLKTVKALAGGPDPVQFVLQSGDAVVNGRDGNQLNVSFTPLINRITTEAGLPYFFTAGNHDVTSSLEHENVNHQIGLANLLAANKLLFPPEGSVRRLNGYPTYAFGYGNTFVLTFDSNVAGDITQFNWVTAQLEHLDRTRYENIIVFCHNPAWSSGPHGGVNLEPSTISLRDFYLPLFRRHHVNLLLVGHDHLFEHWVERYVDSTGAHRLDQIVSAGGGAPLYNYTGEPDLSDYLATSASEQVRVEHLIKPSSDTLGNPHHYLVVHVDGTQLRVEAVGVGWGSGFAPYPKGGLVLRDPAARPARERK